MAHTVATAHREEVTLIRSLTFTVTAHPHPHPHPHRHPHPNPHPHPHPNKDHRERHSSESRILTLAPDSRERRVSWEDVAAGAKPAAEEEEEEGEEAADKLVALRGSFSRLQLAA